MTNSEKFENINQKRHLMIYIFPVVLMSTAILTILRAIAFFLMAKKASYSIHKLVATKVIDAPMPFFDNHFVGNILNRFSEDLLYVDEKVSISLFNVIEVSLVLSHFSYYTPAFSVICTSRRNNNINSNSQYEIDFTVCSILYGDGHNNLHLLENRESVETARNFK
jgi:ABC-type multidrug transport system fused ATPase/permease subunit